MKKKNKYFKIADLRDLRAVLNNGGAGYMDFVISLAGGLCVSRKEMMMSKDKKIFYINNCIDDTEQELTARQLFNPRYTNIGEAIKKGAFFQVL